jgi:hypothetical protein
VRDYSSGKQERGYQVRYNIFWSEKSAFEVTQPNGTSVTGSLGTTPGTPRRSRRSGAFDNGIGYEFRSDIFRCDRFRRSCRVVRFRGNATTGCGRRRGGRFAAEATGFAKVFAALYVHVRHHECESYLIFSHAYQLTPIIVMGLSRRARDT